MAITIKTYKAGETIVLDEVYKDNDGNVTSLLGKTVSASFAYQQSWPTEIFEANEADGNIVIMDAAAGTYKIIIPAIESSKFKVSRITYDSKVSTGVIVDITETQCFDIMSRRYKK